MKKITKLLAALLTVVFISTTVTSCKLVSPTTSTPKKSKNNVEISNSCPDDYSVELVSLTGNKAAQTVHITIKYTNHGINKKVTVKNFLAYNEDGDSFSEIFPCSDKNTLTDVPVKVDWEVGQMLPKKNPRLAAITFEINGCKVEMRNVPIKWR